MTPLPKDDGAKRTPLDTASPPQNILPALDPLPTGSMYDVCPYKRVVEPLIPTITDTRSLEATCRKLTSAYAQEALISRCIAVYNPPEKVRQQIASLGLGIHPGHYLFNLRTHLVSYWESVRCIDLQSQSLVWGGPLPTLKGKLIYKMVGQLLRYDWLRTLTEQPLPDGLSFHGIIRAWITASGIQNRNTLKNVAKLLHRHRNSLLNEEPEEPDSKLMPDVMGLVHEVAQAHGRVVGLAFARCLQRVAAYRRWDPENVGYLARWRSTWLRGEAANPRAIPGTSTHSRLLTELLLTHVFDLYRGHSSGRMAATYLLKIDLPREGGWYGPEEVAQSLGLQLTADGRARIA